MLATMGTSAEERTAGDRPPTTTPDTSAAPGGASSRPPASDAASGGESGQRVAAAVHDLLASFVRLTPRDMSLTSVSVLATLDRTGPHRITELAASEGVSQPAITTLVASLAREGYVERLSDPADKRVVMVAITGTGIRYLRGRRAASTGVFAEAAGRLSADESATLAAALPVLEHLRNEVDELRTQRQGRR